MTGRRKPTLDRTRQAVRDTLDEGRSRRAAPPEVAGDDPVDLASAASMDASDPPSFTATKSGGNSRPPTEERGT
jgi:hypothetical protein